MRNRVGAYQNKQCRVFDFVLHYILLEFNVKVTSRTLQAAGCVSIGIMEEWLNH